MVAAQNVLLLLRTPLTACKVLDLMLAVLAYNLLSCFPTCDLQLCLQICKASACARPPVHSADGT